MNPYLVLPTDGVGFVPGTTLLVLATNDLPSGARDGLERVGDEMAYHGYPDTADAVRRAIRDPATAPANTTEGWVLKIGVALWRLDGGNCRSAVVPRFVRADDEAADARLTSDVQGEAIRLGHPGPDRESVLTWIDTFSPQTLFPQPE